VSGGGAQEPARARLAALLDSLGLEASEPSPCPYLPGRDSRLLVVKPERLLPSLYELFLDLNYRRLGQVVYRPRCDGCRECRQLRVSVPSFRPSRAQRRCRRRNADVVASVAAPSPSDEKHALYRRYLEARHDGQMSGSREEFDEFLHDSAPFTEEVEFRLPGRLLGVGIFDVLPRAISAVYFYFDPELATRSPGVYNVLWLLERCGRLGLPWLYLGYHVAGCAAMEYKAAFRPRQILGEDGAWR
jgi:arginine-tRNA-protein transferase